MKKLLLISLIFILSLSLTACGSSSTDKSSGTKTSSSQKMNKEEGQEKIMELMEKMENGEITEEEYSKKSKEITANIETTIEMLKRTYDNISDFTGLPSWAKEMGVKEPMGLTLIPGESDIIEAKGAYQNSFTASYKGDKAIMLDEAKKIVTELGLNIEYEDENIFSASGKLSNEDYTAIISVGDMVVFSVSDMSK